MLRVADLAEGRKVFWHEHTYRELADILPKLEVVIIPTGSTEIHGPHLGLGNDILVSTWVAEHVAEVMYPRALVANILWVGVAPHNMCKPFPGTITLTAETYMRVLSEAVESLVKHGVRRVVFLNGHGGNVAPNITACREIREMIHYKYGVNIEVGALSYWEVIPDEVWGEVLEAAPRFGKKIGHGGEAETSILMVVAPHTVRTDYIVPPDARPRPRPPFFRAWYQDEYSPDGHSDDARPASREKGLRLLDAAVKGCIAAIEEFIRFKPVGTRTHPGEHQYPEP